MRTIQSRLMFCWALYSLYITEYVQKTNVLKISVGGTETVNWWDCDLVKIMEQSQCLNKMQLRVHSLSVNDLLTPCLWSISNKIYHQYAYGQSCLFV